MKDHPIDPKNMVCQDRWSLATFFCYIEMWVLSLKICGLSRQVVSCDFFLLYWNVGPVTENMWSVKTGGLSWQWSLETGFTVWGSDSMLLFHLCYHLYCFFHSMMWLYPVSFLQLPDPKVSTKQALSFILDNPTVSCNPIFTLPPPPTLWHSSSNTSEGRFVIVADRGNPQCLENWQLGKAKKKLWTRKTFLCCHPSWNLYTGSVCCPWL